MIHPKVIAGTSAAGLGGSLALIIVWAIGLQGVVVPPEIATAFGMICSALAAAVAGYLTPSQGA